MTTDIENQFIADLEQRAALAADCLQREKEEARKWRELAPKAVTAVGLLGKVIVGCNCTATNFGDHVVETCNIRRMVAAELLLNNIVYALREGT